MGVYGRLSHKQMKLIGSEPFSMTVAGLRLSKAANAVSQLHAQTARNMWRGVKGAAPIIDVHHGVHTGTWQAESIAKAKTAMNSFRRICS
jgi:starch phosphorylase